MSSLLDSLKIHVDPSWGADLWAVVGMRGCGKSTLINWQAANFYEDYIAPGAAIGKQSGRMVIGDTKPRFQAEYFADGTRIRDHYKNWGYGEKVPHSRLVRNYREWTLAWQTGANVVILQNERLDQGPLVKWQVTMIEEFWRSQRARIPSLLVLDEGMDFFGVTGNGLHGNTIQRICRAGREKSMATVIGSQRPKSINIQVLSEANCLALFAVKYREDVKRLYEMGLPKWAAPPAEKRQFLLMRDDEVLSERAMLAL